ncbi:unnamed protein product, partial [Rotaria socialis]
EMIVSKPLEVSKEEQQQQESSPVVSEITTSIVTTTTLPDTSTIDISKEEPQIERALPLMDIQQPQQEQEVSDQQEIVASQFDISHVEEPVVEEKGLTSESGQDKSAIMDAIHAVQDILPTSVTSHTDIQEEKPISKDDEPEILTTTLQTSVADEIKHQDNIDSVEQDSSVNTEMISNMVSSNEKS